MKVFYCFARRSIENNKKIVRNHETLIKSKKSKKYKDSHTNLAPTSRSQKFVWESLDFLDFLDFIRFPCFGIIFLIVLHKGTLKHKVLESSLMF